MKVEEEIEARYSDKGFSCLDDFFARSILKKEKKSSKERYFFLCYLMAAFRRGHLCVCIENTHIEPNWGISPDVEECIIRGAYIQPDASGVLYKEDNYYYLQKNWVLETKILEQLYFLVQSKRAPKICQNTLESCLKEKTACKALLHKQAEAIRLSLRHPFVLIFGGPGTGKSYTAVQMLEVLQKSWKGADNPRFLFIAPTGKAAKLLEEKIQQASIDRESILVETSTIHSVLKIPYQMREDFQPEPLNADFVLVDEFSMVDPKVFSFLLEAVSENTHIICMGDPDQLPSVEGGSLLMDFQQMSLSDLLPFHQTLSQAVRFEEKAIFSFAEAVNRGDIQETFSYLENGANDVLYHFLDEMEKVMEESIAWFLRLTQEEKNPLDYLKKVDQFRILSSLRHGLWGVENINRTIFDALMGCIEEGKPFFVPILIVQNDSNQSLYNGMVGVVCSKKSVDNTGFFTPDDRVLFLGEKGCIEKPLYALPRWELAFSLSVHKSQGSEFDEVLCILADGSEVFGKEVLYTAATRAKKKLRICSSKEVLESILQKKSNKVSGLPKRWETYFLS